MERGRDLAEERCFHFCCVGRPGLFKCPSTVSITVGIMEDQRTGQEETLMEVTVGVKGVALTPRARAHSSRGCFKCLLALAALLVLAISVAAALLVYLFIFAPRCNHVRATCAPAPPLPPCCALAAMRGLGVCVPVIFLSACRTHPQLISQQKSTKSTSSRVSVASF